MSYFVTLSLFLGDSVSEKAMACTAAHVESSKSQQSSLLCTFTDLRTVITDNFKVTRFITVGTGNGKLFLTIADTLTAERSF